MQKNYLDFLTGALSGVGKSCVLWLTVTAPGGKAAPGAVTEPPFNHNILLDAPVDGAQVFYQALDTSLSKYERSCRRNTTTCSSDSLKNCTLSWRLGPA